MLASLVHQPRRQAQALERNRSPKAAVMGAVHGAEATFGDDGLDVIRRGDHGAHDTERVYCHLGSRAPPKLRPSWPRPADAVACHSDRWLKTKANLYLARPARPPRSPKCRAPCPNPRIVPGRP